MALPPPDHQAPRRNERPPSYPYSERLERRPRQGPRPRVISFPVELESNYRERGHWATSAERHNERVQLDPNTSFNDIQRQLRSNHLSRIPESAQSHSFAWTTWLKYANGQRRQVREDNWEYMLGEIMTLGSARERRDPRRGTFPVALVTQSSEMSEEVWEGLRHDMAHDERRWGVDGWKVYMLQRGYWFKDRPLSEQERQKRKDHERRAREEHEREARNNRARLSGRQAMRARLAGCFIMINDVAEKTSSRGSFDRVEGARILQRKASQSEESTAVCDKGLARDGESRFNVDDAMGASCWSSVPMQEDSARHRGAIAGESPPGLEGIVPDDQS